LRAADIAAGRYFQSHPIARPALRKEQPQPTQLIGKVREPIPAKPGQLERYDCEYRRNGTVNLFVFLDAHRPWRRVKVTDRRANRTESEGRSRCGRESNN